MCEQSSLGGRNGSITKQSSCSSGLMQPSLLDFKCSATETSVHSPEWLPATKMPMLWHVDYIRSFYPERIRDHFWSLLISDMTRLHGLYQPAPPLRIYRDALRVWYRRTSKPHGNVLTPIHPLMERGSLADAMFCGWLCQGELSLTGDKRATVTRGGQGGICGM